MLKIFDLRNILNHTWFLEDKPSCKATKHLKNKLNFRIYQRTNETFLVSKSFIWWREPIDNTLLKILFSFEILLLFLCLAYKTLVSLKFQVKKSRKNHKNISTFRLFTHVIGFSGGSNCVNSNFEVWTDWIIQQETYKQNKNHMQCSESKSLSKDIQHLKYWF